MIIVIFIMICISLEASNLLDLGLPSLTLASLSFLQEITKRKHENNVVSYMDMLYDNFFVFVCLFFLYLSSTSKLVKRNNENERNFHFFLAA